MVDTKTLEGLTITPRRSVLWDGAEPGTRVAASTLDTNALPPGQRFGLFHAAIGVTHTAARIDGDTHPYDARVQAWLLHDMVVTIVEHGAVRLTREPERIRQDGFDHFTFSCMVRGVGQGMAGVPVHFAPEEVVVFDLTEPMDVAVTDNLNICVRLSRSAMREAMKPLPDLHGRVLTGIPGRVLSEHFAALSRYVADVTDADVALVIRATTRMIATCLERRPDGTPAALPRGVQLRARARLFIERNLSDPDLGPERLCQALNVSRSSLYRAFDGGAGIATYVRNRRLEAAYARLHDGTGQTISQVAHACGFMSESHFSTVFRARFGHPPRAAKTGPREPLGGHLADTYSNWLDGLRRAETDDA